MDREERLARAQAALVRWQKELVRLAYSYTLNLSDAEDCVQDALMAYMKKAPDFESIESEKAWLIRVTVNRCLSLLRTAFRKRTQELPDEIGATEEDKSVLEALKSLPGKYRVTLHLYYYEGYKLQEIAQILKTRPGTVGTWLDRGRQALKLEMEASI
ncbi:MAG: RNA polymerase sigma factor [Clostridiales bacterium]|nr:RNA polymerase sigma factor [Clostridiales bacterium]